MPWKIISVSAPVSKPGSGSWANCSRGKNAALSTRISVLARHGGLVMHPMPPAKSSWKLGNITLLHTATFTAGSRFSSRILKGAMTRPAGMPPSYSGAAFAESLRTQS